MKKSAIAVVLTLAAAGPGGCTAPHPFVREGDAKSVEIVYSGDIASTLPLATRHCAQFERQARMSDAGSDVALYQCVPK